MKIDTVNLGIGAASGALSGLVTATVTGNPVAGMIIGFAAGAVVAVGWQFAKTRWTP